MREPISIDERAKAQEAEAQGKEWKPDPAPKEAKDAPEGKAVTGGLPEQQAPGHQPWNRKV